LGGRPRLPGFALGAGTKPLISFHSWSVRSVGYGCICIRLIYDAGLMWYNISTLLMIGHYPFSKYDLTPARAGELNSRLGNSQPGSSRCAKCTLRVFQRWDFAPVISSQHLERTLVQIFFHVEMDTTSHKRAYAQRGKVPPFGRTSIDNFKPSPEKVTSMLNSTAVQFYFVLAPIGIKAATPCQDLTPVQIHRTQANAN